VLKLVALGTVVLTLLVFSRRDHGPSAASVGSCLEKAGATVSRSRLFEDLYGELIGAPLPEKLAKKLHDLDEHVYDVTLAGDTGYLLDTKASDQAGKVEAAARENGFDMTAQGHGKVVMLWTGGPTAESSADFDRCLG
jgi:hypothetical protein